MVQMANLSVLSPGKWILDILGKHMFRPFLGVLESENPTFFQVNFVGGVVQCFQCLLLESTAMQGQLSLPITFASNVASIGLKMYL